MFKRVLPLVIVLSMLFSFSVFADTGSVDTLNKLDIVKGDSTGFNLEGELKRSEAAVVIIRLLGKEDEVLKNSEMYAVKAIFNDVEPSDWFAPYVGYAVQEGIIDGFADHTFLPNHSVTEKAMVKLVLSVVGYEYNKDYRWDNIYQKAFEFGIFTDESYKTKIRDNIAYTRGDAFDLTRTVLESKVKGKEVSLIESWVEAGRVSKKSVEVSGIILDKLLTAIESTEITNSTSVRLYLNEEIKGIELDDIKIFDANANELKINKVTLKEKLITLVTDGQTKLSDYTVTMNNVTDLEDNVVSGITKEFKGYKPNKITSDKFMISNIQAVSKDTIKVFFTQKINATPTVATFYEIYEGDTLFLDCDSSNTYIAKLPDVENGIILRMTGKDYSLNKIYKIKVAGSLGDATGLKVKDGAGDEMTYPALNIENFSINKDTIYAFNKQVVTVGFTKILDKSSAENAGNYQIIDSNNNVKPGIPKVDPNDPTRVLIGMVVPLDPNTNYKLSILNPVYDLEKASSFVKTGMEFEVENVSVADLKVSLVEVVSNSEVRVYFNRALSASTINLARFLITSSNDSAFNNQAFDKYYFDESSPNTVVFYLNPATKKFKDDGLYTLTVAATVKDYMNQSNGSSTYDFAGVSTEKVSPRLVSAEIVGDKKVKLTFNKQIEANNSSGGNFKAYYKNSDDDDVEIIAISAVVYESKYIIVTFDDSFNTSKLYRIRYLIINDYRNDGFAGGKANQEYLDFAY